MKNLEKLKKAIIKEIPEIVELKFGCEIEIELTERHLYQHIKEVYLGESKGMNHYYYFKNGKKGVLRLAKYDEFEIIKIIGRPITLSDILRVLGKMPPREFPLFVSVTGCFYEDYKNDMSSVLAKWNLSKNNLDLQSKPTIDFLTEIICKKDD